MNKTLYTKVFLQQQGRAINEASMAEVMPVWWQNTRNKTEGGLRLTEAGFEMLKELEIEMYEISFPLDMQLTTQVIIYLDKFIDSPYYLTNKSVFVTNEKKAVELTLFSGDIRKYGIAKAMRRPQE
jgi:NAD-dependent DNA ligase